MKREKNNGRINKRREELKKTRAKEQARRQAQYTFN